MRTSRLFATARRHLNRGQRALFFALPSSDGSAARSVFMMTTVAVVVVIGVGSSRRNRCARSRAIRRAADRVYQVSPIATATNDANRTAAAVVTTVTQMPAHRRIGLR